MGLLGLVLRALGVTLLSATVLLPIADHHAASRLPEALTRPATVQEAVLHHHGQAHRRASSAAPAVAELPALSTVLPGATFWAEGAGAPNAAAATTVPAPKLAPLGWLNNRAVLLPPSLDRAPPSPPPLLSA